VLLVHPFAGPRDADASFLLYSLVNYTNHRIPNSEEHPEIEAAKQLEILVH